MTDDELELKILERYIARFAEAERDDPNRRDKCSREVDMRDVLRELTGKTSPELEDEAEIWFRRLAPRQPGDDTGPLRPCSEGTKNRNEHKYHARAFLNDSGDHPTPAWDRIRELKREIQRPASPSREGTTATTIRLFISHSSKDEELARCLVELFRFSLNLPDSAIRCTSVAGYGLPGGAETDDQLRREVLDAEAFVVVVSASSSSAPYVLSEVGARWGSGRHLLPVLSPGTPATLLWGPLARLNALRSDNRSQLHQLVEELGHRLSIPRESPAAYEDALTKVLEIRVFEASPKTSAPLATDAPPRLSEDAVAVLLALAHQDQNTATVDGLVAAVSM